MNDEHLGHKNVSRRDFIKGGQDVEKNKDA